MENVKELMELANKAKNMGLYYIANAIFAIIYDSLAVTDGLSVELETEDRDGFGNNVYYDLAVVRYGSQSICIPIPLLSFDTAVTFAKIAPMVDRIEHNREVDGSGVDEQTDVRFRDEIMELSELSGDEIRRSIYAVFGIDDDDDVYVLDFSHEEEIKTPDDYEPVADDEHLLGEETLAKLRAAIND